MARFTVYLPDPLCARAREASLNLSGLLRQAVIVALREKSPPAGVDDANGVASSAPAGGDET